MNYFGFLKNILWLNNLTENCTNSPKTSFRWFIVVESTVRWFIVREKYCWMTADLAE
jgi:hypothetical protein